MKHFILTILLAPIILFSQITEDSSSNNTTIIKKLYTKGSFIFGPGSEKIMVGKKYYEDSDKDPQDINILPGGGVGVEAVIGYDISKLLAFEFSIGTQNSGSYIDKDNVAQFKKSQIRASLLYRIPIGKKYTPYVGAGLSSVISAKYVEDSQGIESEVTYTKPTGFHVLGGAEWKNPKSPLFLFGEIRFLILGEFEADETTVSNYILETIGIDIMSANGLQFSFGIGYYIN